MNFTAYQSGHMMRGEKDMPKVRERWLSTYRMLAYQRLVQPDNRRMPSCYANRSRFLTNFANLTPTKPMPTKLNKRVALYY